MSDTFEYKLTRENEATGEEETFELEVLFEYYKGSKGFRNSLGVPEEPDEPAGIEILAVTLDGEVFITTDLEDEKITEEIQKDLSDF